MSINAVVSQNIKNARKQRNLTLDGASAATGVSRSMLAQIEKGEANPTISVIWKIAKGYKMPFTALVASDSGETQVVKAASIEPFVESDGKYLNYPIFGFDGRKDFEIYRIEILKGGFLKAEAHLDGTQEYITVFAGDIEISVADQKYELHTGDSIRFTADVPHSYRNIGEKDVELSMILYYKR